MPLPPIASHPRDEHAMKAPHFPARERQTEGSLSLGTFSEAAALRLAPAHRGHSLHFSSGVNSGAAVAYTQFSVFRSSAGRLRSTTTRSS